ncbi:MAG: hypothetical protein HQL88_05495 [Magnetococcales bacterium]|nr:hypothetical protein [Magnetococcales bacterium]
MIAPIIARDFNRATTKIGNTAKMFEKDAQKRAFVYTGPGGGGCSPCLQPPPQPAGAEKMSRMLMNIHSR